MTPVNCPRCQALNPPDAERCMRCNSPLDASAALAGPSGFSEGLMINQNYRLVRAIGEGGMGQVWEALQVTIDRTVAIKFLHPELMRHPTARERVLQEAVTLGRVDHRNVVRIIECFETSNSVALVLEYIKGGSLSDLIEAEGAIPWQKALQYVDGILKGLGALHRSGIVHRDMKPDNVLLSVDDDGEVTPKVTDLGIAHDESSARLTRDGSRLGTPEYMAPEQVRGLDVDTRGDLYSTGVVLYEMLMGEVPFTGTDYDIMHGHASLSPDLDRLPPDIPVWLKNALAVALAKDPNDRFASYTDFRNALSPDGAVDVSRIPAPISPATSGAQSGTPAPNQMTADPMDVDIAWSETKKGLKSILTSATVASYGIMANLVAVFSYSFLDSDLGDLIRFVTNIFYVTSCAYLLIGLFKLTKAPEHVDASDVANGAFYITCVTPFLFMYVYEEITRRRGPDVPMELLIPCLMIGASWICLSVFFARLGRALDEEDVIQGGLGLRNLIIGLWFLPVFVGFYSEIDYAVIPLTLCWIFLLIRQSDLLKLTLGHMELISE